MKNQYIVGQPTKDFIRVTDGVNTLSCSLTLEEAKEAVKSIGRVNVYKLVMVDPKTLRN